MKKMLRCLLIPSLTILVLCCKKKDNEDNQAATPSFMVSNLQDFRVRNNDSVDWEIPVEWRSGEQEKVTVAIEGLPPGVTSTPKEISGRPPFKPRFKIAANLADLGDYTISVRTSSAAQGVKSYDMLLTVASAQVCGVALEGTYDKSTSTYMNSTRTYRQASVKALKSANKVRITCACTQSYDATAEINCDTRTLTIPEQLVSSLGRKIKGTGAVLAGQQIALMISIEDITGASWETYADTLQQ